MVKELEDENTFQDFVQNTVGTLSIIFFGDPTEETEDIKKCLDRYQSLYSFITFRKVFCHNKPIIISTYGISDFPATIIYHDNNPIASWVKPDFSAHEYMYNRLVEQFTCKKRRRS